MPEGMRPFGQPKPTEKLAMQRKHFLGAEGDKFTEDEETLKRLQRFKLENKDGSIKGDDEVLHGLQQILGYEKGTEAWENYIEFLRTSSTEGLIEVAETQSEHGTNLLRFIDWEYIKDHADRVVKRTSTEGEVVCGPDNMGEALHIVMYGQLKYQGNDKFGHMVKRNDELPYAIFGEQSILKHHKMNSTDTVVTNRAVTLAIPASLLLESLDRYKKEKVDLGELLEVPISPEAAAALIEAGRIDFYRRNQIMMPEGSAANKVMIILEGKALIVENSKSIDEVGRGAFLGELEQVAGEEKYHASVVSATNSDPVVLVIGKDDFKRILAEHPDLTGSIHDNIPHKRRDERIIREYGGNGMFSIERTRLDLKDPEKKELFQSIQREANITVGLIKEVNPDADAEALKELFDFLCMELEEQELRNPAYLVPHGAAHSISVSRFSNSCLEKSTILNKCAVDRYGSEKRAEIIMRLAALLHDIGYIELEGHKSQGIATPKWRHQEMSGGIVRKHLSREKLNAVFPLEQDEYDDLLKAIEHHGSDKKKEDAPEDAKSGRQFVAASLTKDPILVVMRIADNLDLGVTRLNSIQSSPEFIGIMKQLQEATVEASYHEGVLDKEAIDYTDEEGSGKEKRYQQLHDIVEREMAKLRRQFNQLEPARRTRARSRFLQQLDNALLNAVEYDDWRGHWHFKRAAMVQGAYIGEEMSDYKGRPALQIFIEYNYAFEDEDDSSFQQDAENLRLGIFKSTERSFVDEEGNTRTMHVSYRRVFPVAGDNLENMEVDKDV